jgi:hypothetical protein
MFFFSLKDCDYEKNSLETKKKNPYQIIIFSRPIVQIVVSLQIDAMESVDLKVNPMKYFLNFFPFCKIDCGNCKIVETKNRSKILLRKLRSIKKSEAKIWLQSLLICKEGTYLFSKFCEMMIRDRVCIRIPHQGVVGRTRPNNPILKKIK